MRNFLGALSRGLLVGFLLMWAILWVAHYARAATSDTPNDAPITIIGSQTNPACNIISNQQILLVLWLGVLLHQTSTQAFIDAVGTAYDNDPAAVSQARQRIDACFGVPA